MVVTVKVPSVVIPVEHNLFRGAGDIVQDHVEVCPVGVIGDLAQIVQQGGAGGLSVRRNSHAGVQHIHFQIVVFHPITGLAFHPVVEREVVFNGLVFREGDVEDGVCVRNSVCIDVGGATVRRDIERMSGFCWVVLSRKPGGGAIYPLVGATA